MIKKLIDCGVKTDQIVVLSPYRAQCHIIGQDLAKEKLSEIRVMSIVQSQGMWKCLQSCYKGSLLYYCIRTRADKDKRHHTYMYLTISKQGAVK